MKVRHNMKMSHGFLINLHFTDSVTDKERNIYIYVYLAPICPEKIISFIKIKRYKVLKSQMESLTLSITLIIRFWLQYW